MRLVSAYLNLFKRAIILVVAMVFTAYNSTLDALICIRIVCHFNHLKIFRIIQIAMPALSGVADIIFDRKTKNILHSF